MGQLRSLAGQTAIYGVSSILGRVINYLLVGLHTAIFLPEQLGIVASLFAYTAIFLVIYTYGMETTFFRFAKDNLEKAYTSSCTVVIIISTVLSATIYFNSDFLAPLIGYPSAGKYIEWLAIILWIDAVLSIPFGRLRFENKAKKFASIKIANILINIGLQFFFLLIIPSLDSSFEVTIGSIFLANLIANALMVLMLYKEVIKIRFHWDKQVMQTVFSYSTPIFLMGLAGMMNEQLDKILIEHFLPDSYYKSMDSTAATGVYSQTFKLGVLMMLAVQAFRYAGEPFFFAQADDKKAPELFARVMHYFVIFGLLLFVLVSLNVDFIASIFLRQPEYRVALYLVPLILFGKLIYGVYLNLSIWFKITDKTRYGLYFSLIGLFVTLAGNVLLLPKIGLLGCAISIICCYLSMSLVCYIIGQKHFPIPYNFTKLIPYAITAVVLVYMGELYQHPNFTIDTTINIVCSILITIVLWVIEKNKLSAGKL
ncbi:oligosaccharide flippase family protein [Fulvivirga lutea]|uniref:Polysaccharide biosynthesis protein n=1 Tax=Fulvivirga lutea TaxID=2810512 RepID=A0A974WHY8_9BACT|nr:oligosaccharide flippase family protein [Fulvivirga lutea]QSE97487.1 polysaccharide biosynthesis protein [Fulvivirga lutea]